MARRHSASPKPEREAASPARSVGRRAKGAVSICRLRVPLPDSAWIARFSRHFPEVRIEVLSRLDVDRARSLTEVELHAPDSRGWAARVRELPQVDEVEELEGGQGRIHLRVIHRTSTFVPIFRELRLMRRFPFAIQAGEATWVIVASESTHRALLAKLRERAPSAVVETVRRADPDTPTGPLTPRQAELLRRSMAAGYFEVPRKVTLTELARNLGMATSSLSEALALVEKKLIERWPIPA